MDECVSCLSVDDFILIKATVLTVTIIALIRYLF